jgi:hypothetical protein
MKSLSEKVDDEVEVEAVLAVVVAVDEETELTLMASLPDAAGRRGPGAAFRSSAAVVGRLEDETREFRFSGGDYWQMRRKT